MTAQIIEFPKTFQLAFDPAFYPHHVEIPERTALVIGRCRLNRHEEVLPFWCEIIATEGAWRICLPITCWSED